MSLFTKLNIKDAAFVPYLNTGTMLDLMVGQFISGTDGSTILNGGYSSTNGIVGKPNQYKSTTALGLVTNAMSRYPHSEHVIFDTEQSIKDKHRLVMMSDLYLDKPEERAIHLDDLSRRIALCDITSYPDADSFFEKIKEIYQEKLQHIKDYTVETPLIDPITGRARLMVTPTFITIDSWSKAPVRAGLEMMDKNEVSSSDTNMYYMRDGLIKNKILNQLPSMAAKAGLYFMLTAQVGEKFNMNAFLPTKDMQYMGLTEKIKGAGSDYNFLISTTVAVQNAKVLQTKDRECEYPLPGGMVSDTEMSSNTMKLVRCKNNNSGSSFFPVMTQSGGYQAQLTNYHYLRENGGFGLGSNKVNTRTPFLPKTLTGRTTVVKDLRDNYQLARAVEILAQLCYIQNNWTVLDMIVPYDITPDQLAEKLFKSSYAMEDILNSRGWWSYGQFDRPMLTLFDILAIATDKYKPKFLSVKLPK